MFRIVINNTHDIMDITEFTCDILVFQNKRFVLHRQLKIAISSSSSLDNTFLKAACQVFALPSIARLLNNSNLP